MKTFWRYLLLLIFGPSLLLVGLNYLAALLAIVLPVLVVLAIIMGAVAGVTMAFILKRRLPPRNNGRYIPPSNLPPVKRPRGPRSDD